MPAVPNEPLPYDRIAYLKIKNAIVGGYFKAGERLREQELAEKIGISRTPIREALRRLEREGYLEKLHYKGATVRKFSLKEAEHIYQIRAALEGLSAYLLAQVAGAELVEKFRRNLSQAGQALAEQDLARVAAMNDEFHDLLANGHHNEILSDMLLNLRGCISILRVSTWTAQGRPAQTIEEHKEIVEAVAQKMPEAARSAAVRHIGNSWQVASAVLSRGVMEL
ncbi:MAG: GntR family transcriptional regulator [Dehalococcoidales bacterium]|nr:GntR family transcriptional regulator [Dehalococcoidales bacterium]